MAPTASWIAGVPDSVVAIVPLALMVFYFIGVALTIANYSGYFRFNPDTYGYSFTRAYITFTVLGAVGYFLVAGPAWLWAAKYTTEPGQRVTRICVGMAAIFLLHDLPIFVMEYHAILCCGWRNEFQGFVFVVQFIEFVISFCFGWLAYTYVMSGILERSYGAESGGFIPFNGSAGGLKTGAERIDILPPMSAASTPMLSEPQPIIFPQPGSVGSRRDVRWTSDDRTGPFSSSSRRSGGGRQQKHSPASPVPLRENLRDARYGGDEGSESDDGDDPRYGGSGGYRGPQPRFSPREGSAQPSFRSPREGGMRPYGGGGGAVEMQPMTYSLPPMHISGYTVSDSHVSPSMPPTQPVEPRRLGSVFVERTVF